MCSVLIATNLWIICLLHPSMNKKEKKSDLKHTAGWIVVTTWCQTSGWKCQMLFFYNARYIRVNTYIHICAYTHTQSTCIWKYMIFGLCIMLEFLPHLDLAKVLCPNLEGYESCEKVPKNARKNRYQKILLWCRS